MTSKVNFVALSGGAAIGFASMIVLVNLVLAPAGLPAPGADPDEAAAFFAANRGLAGTAAALTPAVWVLATVFGAGAVSVLWAAERGRGEAWALAGFAGLVLQNATFTGVVATRLALAEDGGAAPLWVLHDALLTLNGTFLALAMTGLSLAGRRAGLLPAWHARLGFVAAGLQFTSATLAPLVIAGEGPLGMVGLAGWLLWVVWLVGYGLALLRARAGLSPSPLAGPA
ncbi:hypothetical protein [Actinophytocola xanthii]|uniref:DUF4386 domain-containing protein n=1 Tax=Actinophytocola xanthii TaxID=1912961 RepID=A0A1Q8CNW0_9PSEU|nr:hypothetical protein [Actinophytocola xanthii]OLF16033.1 hypothetical protein BU204_19265 [Actinophytocola xanthii]